MWERTVELAFRINMDSCDQILDQQIPYQVVNQVGRVFEFSGRSLNRHEGTGLAPCYSSN